MLPRRFEPRHRQIALALALALTAIVPLPSRPALAETASAETLLAEMRSVLDAPRARLLIVGTFHFEDAGLDEYKPEHAVDVLSPERQREVAAVVDALAGFRPTHVAVEWPKSSQARADERYRAYLEGTYELEANEVYQLGFRLAAQMGHERVHLVDAPGRRYEPAIDRDQAARELGLSHLMESPWYARYETLHKLEDRAKTRVPLAEMLLYLSSPERAVAAHGIYLVGGFRLVGGDTYPGADFLTGFWYSRNLRIFANLLELARSPADRVVLVIGAGHVPILRHLAAASPEVELVELADVLRPGGASSDN